MNEELSWETWEDVIEELDACPDLTGKSQDFIISLMERRPKFLTSRQVEWLEDLKRRHLL